MIHLTQNQYSSLRIHDIPLVHLRSCSRRFKEDLKSVSYLRIGKIMEDMGEEFLG